MNGNEMTEKDYLRIKSELNIADRPIFHKEIKGYSASGKEILDQRCLSDNEALEAYRTYQNLQTWEERVDFIAKTTSIDNLFNPSVRVIKGEEYEFGLFRDQNNVQVIGSYVYIRLKQVIFWDAKKELNEILQAADERRQKLIVQEYINQVRRKVEKTRPAYDNDIRKFGFYDREWHMGYIAEALGSVPQFEVDNFSRSIILEMAHGAVAYLMEYVLTIAQEDEKKQEKADTSFGGSITQNVHSLKGAGLKLVYLWSTGVYEYLAKTIVKKNGEPHKANIAKTIAHFTGEEAETIKELLRFMDYPKHSDKNNPFNLGNIIKVMNALADDIKYSGEYLDRLIKLRQEQFPDSNE